MGHFKTGVNGHFRACSYASKPVYYALKELNIAKGKEKAPLGEIEHRKFLEN